MGCPDLTTSLTPGEAKQILEPYFREVQRLFVEHGLTLVKRARLICDRSMHDTPRHFAGTSQNGREIVVAPEMVELPEPFVLGIMAHELGHATDFLYPGEFVIWVEHGEGEAIVRRAQDSVDERQWLRWQRAWDKRESHVVEKTADLIAGLVWGAPIGYEGPCLLETFEGGVSRPRELR